MLPVTKRSRQGVAEPGNARHAFQVDQREWDYGARLPRERSAADSWPPSDSPESPDSSKNVEPGAPIWGNGSVTDTGSMQPIPEAIAWSLRAEAWAQNEDQAVERSSSGTVSRWSDVAATGRPPVPADGVGWRTSTAEWRATTESARWRQTTEWRSSTGSHGWRTTTEAWQSGAEDEAVPPPGVTPGEPPTRLPAISGTAWPTPDSAAEQNIPSWQQAADTPSWQQRPADAAPSWRQAAADSTPSWQQRPVDPTPSWQSPPSPTSSWPQAAEATPSWQQPNDRLPGQVGDSTPSWQQRPVDPTPSWQSPPSPTSSWPQAADPTPSWQQQRPPDAPPSWQRPADAAPSWQQGAADSVPSWQQRPLDPTPSWQQPPSDPTPSWQQSAPPRPADAAPSWQRPDDRPSWQQYSTPPASPSSSMPSMPSSSMPSAASPSSSMPSWDTRSDRPSWDTRSSWQPTSEPPRSSWSEDGRHLVREDDRAQWRRESAAGSPQVGRRRAPEPGSRTGGGTGWTTRSDADNWAGHTDTGSMPAFQDPMSDTGSWRRDATQPPSPLPPSSDSWRTSTTTDSWRSGDESRGAPRRTDNWQSSEPPTGSWRSGDQARGPEPRDGWNDSGSWRRDPEPAPAVDPWAHSATETGIISLPQDGRPGNRQSRTDTGSWQRESGTNDGRGETGRRGRSDRPYEIESGSPSGSWQRREIESASPSASGSWQRDEPPAPGGPRPRDGDSRQQDGRSDTGSWQRNGRPEPGDTGSWQREGRPAPGETGSWQREGRPAPGETGSWQREGRPAPGDTGSWQREERPAPGDTGSWQREERPAPGDTGSWQRDGRPEPSDTGSLRRDGRPAPGDTGSLRRDGRPAPGDTGSWQRDGRTRPADSGRPDQAPGPGDTGSLRRDGRPAPGDTGSWQRDGRPDQVPGPGDTGSWQRDGQGRTPERRPARPRGPESQREPRRGLDAQRGVGMPGRKDSQREYARRREPDTSWQRELETASWDRDPETEVWLRDSDTGQWHRAEADDDEDDEDDRGDEPRPRRRRRAPDSPPGGPPASEGTDEGPEGGRRTGGRRRAADAPLQLGSAPEAPISQDAYRRDGEGPTRPLQGRARELEAGPGRQRDGAPDGSGRALSSPGTSRSGPADAPVSAAPGSYDDRPVSAAPGDYDRPVSAAPGGFDRPVSAAPVPGAVDRPVSAAPVGRQQDEGSLQDRGAAQDWRREMGGDQAKPGAGRASVQADAQSEDWLSQLRAETGGPRPSDAVTEVRPAAWLQEERAQNGPRQDGNTASWLLEERAQNGRAQGAPEQAGPASWLDEERAQNGRKQSGPELGAPAPWLQEERAQNGRAPDPSETAGWLQEERAQNGRAPDPSGTANWLQEERAQSGRAPGAGGQADWRRELAADGDLADGESRRFSTSNFVPFRAPSQGGAAGSVKVPAANSASAGATEVIQRTGASWQDPPDTEWPPRGAVMTSPTGSYERRPVSTLTSASARQNDLLEPDDEIEEDTGGPLKAVGYTVGWYGVPVVLFVLYMLLLSGQQTHALDTIAKAAPQFGLSLVLSMLVAVGLRWASGSWKAASVGLAAAVMGGGLATVLTSAITGQSLS
ncbi:hypothetical protein Ahu01nite_032290 [Winogradskya humida]|uniref:Uncharacterized protein n=2 Tax=Winogradskya humida TaxID=113566 RepID=A0ABQ3ZNK6_9ACTN|nr:hypothetical protein Ahu01nite_032290 [Actinoplanes humidus]